MHLWRIGNSPGLPEWRPMNICAKGYQTPIVRFRPAPPSGARRADFVERTLSSALACHAARATVGSLRMGGRVWRVRLGQRAPLAEFRMPKHWRRLGASPSNVHKERAASAKRQPLFCFGSRGGCYGSRTATAMTVVQSPFLSPSAD